MYDSVATLAQTWLHSFRDGKTCQKSKYLKWMGRDGWALSRTNPQKEMFINIFLNLRPTRITPSASTICQKCWWIFQGPKLSLPTKDSSDYSFDRGPWPNTLVKKFTKLLWCLVEIGLFGVGAWIVKVCIKLLRWLLPLYSQVHSYGEQIIHLPIHRTNQKSRGYQTTH